MAYLFFASYYALITMAISVSVKVRLQLGHYNRFSRTCSVLEVIKQAWDIKYGSRFTVAFFKSLNSHCFLTFWSPYLTIRFHFAVVCSVIDARVTSQRGKNKKVAHETKSRGSQMFLPCCDVLYSCASITEQTTAKWNQFVLYNKYMKKYISKDLSGH